MRPKRAEGAFFAPVQQSSDYPWFLKVYFRLAFSASTSRLRVGTCVVRDPINLLVTAVVSSTASWKAFSFTFDGLLNPLTFLTNCKHAARTSSSVAGGSKLKSVLIFLHILASR